MRSATAAFSDWIRRHGDEWIDYLTLPLVLLLLPPRVGWQPFSWIVIATALLVKILAPRGKSQPQTDRWQRTKRAIPSQLMVIAATAIVSHLVSDRAWSEASWGLVWLALAAAIRLTGRPIWHAAKFFGAWLVSKTPEGYLPTRVFRRIWPKRAIAAVQLWLEAGAAGAGVEAIILAGAAWLGPRLNPNLLNVSSILSAAPCVWLALRLVKPERWLRAASASRWLIPTAQIVLWALALPAWASLKDHVADLQPLQAWAFDGAVLLAGAAWARRNGPLTTAESVRWILLGTFALWLVHPLAFPDPLGTDAQWYGEVMSDAITQFRAGVFPVMVGQSEFQFNGSISPIRIAPLFQHLGMLIDLASLRTLTPGAIQNSLVIVLGIASAGTAYRTLAELLPRQRWLATALTIIYLGCPGVVAVLYGADLYMTWTTVPILPLVLSAHLRTYRETPGPSLRELAFWIGLLWWAHSPTAMWTTTLLGGAQLLRLWQTRHRERWTSVVLSAAAIFGLILLYPFVSVMLANHELGPSKLASDYHNQAFFLHQSFPGTLLPVSLNGRQLADYQLGWTLWLLAGYTWIRGRRARGFWALGIPWIVVMALLTPLPQSHSLWVAVPGILGNVTGDWVATRLCLLAAAFLVWLAAVGLAGSIGTLRKRILLGLVLTAGLGWTIFEDTRFVYGAAYAEERAGRGVRSLARENRTLTRYSYLFFPGSPAYFTHGVVEPELEQRLLSRDASRIITGNLEVLQKDPLPPGATVLSEGLLEGTRAPGPPLWNLRPKFELRPGERYVLIFEFYHPAAGGVLKIAGDTLFRLYGLPIYGGPASFGSSPGASPVLPFSSDSSKSQKVALTFIPQGNSEHQDFSHFGRYRWIRYDPGRLPIVVKSWIPYRAEIDSAQPGWLETPRMYQPGYSAKVNGHEVEAKRSSNGLIMVPVPSGRSEAILEYHPLGLTLCYWTSLAAIVCGSGLVVAGSRRRDQPLPPD